MKIELRRIPTRQQVRQSQPVSGTVSGSLHINGQFVCHTEEHPRTALPPGEYRIIRHHCKHYGRHMPVLITNSPNHPLAARCIHCRQQEHVGLNTTLPCICPMLKPGNGVHHREDGSIILGTRIIPGCLKHPLQAFNPLAERIRKALSRGTEVRLIIVEKGDKGDKGDKGVKADSIDYG